MGPNGAGKSLLLKLLHGLIEPTEGQVRWAELPPRQVMGRQAMVFQKPVLLRRSVAANLDFVLKARGKDRVRRDTMLAHAGLSHKANQPARLLSGGEAQRLALSRALATDPEVLLLDEPTASLDPASVLAIEQIVSEARNRGVRIIFVTHDIGQARRMADDVVFLHRGRVAEHSPAATFFPDPRSDAARDYLNGRIDSIIVQSTTSTANSGLYDYLLPIFQGEAGITVNVVAVGTGQAIKNAQNCDGDVLLVHAKPSEEKFVADGFGTERTDLMYNDFVIVGPADDPAGVGGMKDVQAALAQIAEKSALFASRGDESGTHKKEMALWSDVGVDPTVASGDWYRETGSGMGATLNTGIGMGAYVMTDRATWISFQNKQDYQIAVQGDEDMFNQYGVILISPDKCPAVNTDAAQDRKVAMTELSLSDHEYLTVKELAELLRLKERKVYDLAAAGAVPCSRVTGKLLFPSADIRDWLERGQSASRGSGTSAPSTRPPIVLGSHDPLLDWAIRQSGCGLATYFDGSHDGLDRFVNAEGVATGLHIRDSGTGEWNRPVVCQHAVKQNAVLTAFAVRRRGLIYSPSDIAPRSIAGLTELRIARRQPGSGTDILLRDLVRQEGQNPDDLDFIGMARTEDEAAEAVRLGQADVAFGLEGVARRYDLGFLPFID
ncbi:unnamed protein product, partial [Cyprideis torosa]